VAERKTFMAGYFYNWLKGGYYLQVDGLDDVGIDLDDDVIFVVDKMIEERLNSGKYTTRTGRWLRFKIDDLRRELAWHRTYLAVYGLR
jgi:hypothetical protein